MHRSEKIYARSPPSLLLMSPLVYSHDWRALLVGVFNFQLYVNLQPRSNSTYSLHTCQPRNDPQRMGCFLL